MNSEWYYLECAQKRGPLESEQIREMIARGTLDRTVMVAREGEQQWRPVIEVFEIVSERKFPGPGAAIPSSIKVYCIGGPDKGKSFLVGGAEVPIGRASGGLADPVVRERHVTFWWAADGLHFRGQPGCQLLVNAVPVPEGILLNGQQFGMGSSFWQVGATPATVSNLVDSIKDRLSGLASTDKLEGFSLKEMFSEVFKKRTPGEVEEYFIVGTSRTTPPISQVQTGWPKPWFFMRVLLFIGVVYFGFSYAMDQFRNENLVPGLIMMGSLAVPLATVVLFFELNTPRNVSFHQVLMLVCFGGIVSLFVSLIGFSVSNLDWLGASSAGIVEEAGKLVAVALIARKAKYKYILNGMLFGAAVGAGFAVFESAGYAFRELLKENFSLDAMSAVIHVRAFLTPFGHVAWTAISAGALWRVKGDRHLTPMMFANSRFLKAFSIPVVLHMIWNSPLPSPFFLLHLALGAAGWFVVFGLVQQGLYQVRDEQIQTAQSEFAVIATGR
jgi:RsiW-degrading membrane proteinase PrsW (M82 family)